MILSIKYANPEFQIPNNEFRLSNCQLFQPYLQSTKKIPQSSRFKITVALSIELYVGDIIGIHRVIYSKKWLNLHRFYRKSMPQTQIYHRITIRQCSIGIIRIDFTDFSDLYISKKTFLVRVSKFHLSIQPWYARQNFSIETCGVHRVGFIGEIGQSCNKPSILP
jgi:hypothetical protein